MLRESGTSEQKKEDGVAPNQEEADVRVEVEHQSEKTKRESTSATRVVLDHVKYRVPAKTILHGVSFSLRTGELCAIMGPSGGGKTTLLSLLTGVASPSEGSITLNGVEVRGKALSNHMAYVPQDDFLLHTSTTQEALMESAMFHDVDHKGREHCESKVEKIMKQFNLLNCKDVQIGSPEKKKGLSGGQRKRLSIAVEMLHSKTFLVLDEPTSGLDSSSANSVVGLLKTTSERGAGVAATIHSPSSSLFYKFDRVLLLVDGRMAYFGAVKDMISFFSEIKFDCPSFTNPADWAMDLLTKDEEKETDADDARIALIVEHASKIQISYGSGAGFAPTQKTTEDENTTREMSEMSQFEEIEDERVLPFFEQLKILLKRNLRHSAREPALAKARFLSHLVIGIVIGVLYWDLPTDSSSVPDRIAYILFCVIFLMLSVALPTVITFLPERAVFIKEERNKWYSPFAFYAAKGIADLPLQILPLLIYFSISYFMAKYGENGDPDGSRFGTMLVSLFLLVLMVHAWATLIACVAPDLQTAIFLTPISFMPMLLTMGFFKPIDSISWVLRWFSYFPNFFRPIWTMVSIAGFIDFQFTDGVNGNQVLSTRLQIDPSWDEFYREIGVLLAYFIAARILAFIALIKIHVRR